MPQYGLSGVYSQMKHYNKLILGIFIVLTIMIITSCSSVVNYQNSIFQDENKIVENVDSYTYRSRIGKSRGNKYDVKFASFSGMDTIYKIKSDGENDVVFAFESVIEDGEFKVVLITPDDEIINLVNGTKEGNERIKIKEGVNRIKLVGKKAKGEIKLKIDSGEDIAIKRVD